MTPRLIAANPVAKAAYDRAMRAAWDAKNRLLSLDVPLEFAMYVLPNAKALRMVESGPLIALVHKWLMRTCFNAQEEIYLASMDELAALREVHPKLARHIGPPCVVRNGLIVAPLHRGHALLRHPRVARFSQRRATALADNHDVAMARRSRRLV